MNGFRTVVTPGMEGNSNLDMASSREPILPPCRVCGNKASGLHYGVNTCEGCKVRFYYASHPSIPSLSLSVTHTYTHTHTHTEYNFRVSLLKFEYEFA